MTPDGHDCFVWQAPRVGASAVVDLRQVSPKGSKPEMALAGPYDHTLNPSIPRLSYFHFAGGFSSPEGVDISPHPGRTDPLYAVSARREDAAPLTESKAEL